MGIKALKYAGIGPRQTPQHILEMMVSVAIQLDEQGWMVRSGHARGADQAWAIAHRPQLREIWLPWNRFNNASEDGRMMHVCPSTPAIEAVAKLAHPGWANLTDGSRRLMMRNVAIILGPQLDEPVKFVAYWSPSRKAEGGTGNAVRLASMYGIPSFNIGLEEDQQAMSNLVDQFQMPLADS